MLRQNGSLPRVLDMNSVREIIENLNLEPHPEGGYFRRTYESELKATVDSLNAERKLLSCIYYLLTSDSPIGHLHENSSDIVHFFQMGSPIDYTLVSPEGKISQTTLGPNIGQGQQPQLVVPSGWWKASELTSGQFGLISEAVSPGFEYEDMRFIPKVEANRLKGPQHNALGRLCRH